MVLNNGQVSGRQALPAIERLKRLVEKLKIFRESSLPQVFNRFRHRSVAFPCHVLCHQEWIPTMTQEHHASMMEEAAALFKGMKRPGGGVNGGRN